MSRSTNILGFAFLALAATLTAMITMRNSPQPTRRDRAVQQVAHARARVAVGNSEMRRENPRTRGSTAAALPQRPRISFDKTWLDSLTADERNEWQARAVAVERQAIGQLEHLTDQLALSRTQRAKLFPALARSAPGFDPVMMIGGEAGYGRGDLTPAEEIHALLDEDQQAAVEDEDVNRQLWWQTIIDRLEADLTYETGGGTQGGDPAPATPELEVPAGDREAPAARDNSSLFDLLNR